MRRMITDKLTKNIKEVVKAYDDGEIALTEDIPTKTSDLTNDSDFITINDVPEVVANPTLVGDEANLTGLQVGDTKYAVPQGGGGSQLYQHNIKIIKYGSSTTSWSNVDTFITAKIVTNSNTQINTFALLQNYLHTNGFVDASEYGGDTNAAKTCLPVFGRTVEVTGQSGEPGFVYGICYYDADSLEMIFDGFSATGGFISLQCTTLIFTGTNPNYEIVDTVVAL